MSFPYQIDTLEQYQQAYRQSHEDPETFWAGISSHFNWQKPWHSVVNSDFHTATHRWFEGGQLNITENCLDRYAASQPDTTAILWEPNDPKETGRNLTYRQLLDDVMLFANVLKHRGIGKGDRVCIYMGMVPELAIAVLACARIGAIHSVIFGGFSASSIADRVQDAGAKAIITCDGAFRGAKTIPLKSVVDEALPHCPSVQTAWVLRRTHEPVSMLNGRDYDWHTETEAMQASGNTHCLAESMDAEDPLFILYTSGSTGKPKGVVHTTAGYMIWSHYTFVNVFQYQPGQIHFCTADIGWITGHSYILYGPLSAGATTLMFEGIPTWPDAGRFWDIVQKYRADILYTAPTAIRSLMTFGTEPLQNKDLSSLKVLGTVGEPINAEAWHWYDREVGKGEAPIADTWWQTETGGIMISNLAGVTPAKPTFATLPLPGVFPVLVDENGKEITGNGVSGNLCIQKPWPGIIRSTWGDHERCRQTYFSTYPGLYFTGDGCLRDEDGHYRITGRVDDVLNVSGHRIGTAEVENAINMHAGVVESAVVGFPHDIKGQGIYAYVICNTAPKNESEMRKDILQTVSQVIGPIAKPDAIQFVSGLPKTRSGKIMRRILRKIAEGETQNLGDTTTLLDPGVVEEILRGKEK
jgi:acetyl-CoA synthetase